MTHDPCFAFKKWRPLRVSRYMWILHPSWGIRFPVHLWPVARPKCVCNSKIHGYVPRRVDLGDHLSISPTYIPLKNIPRTSFHQEFMFRNFFVGSLGYVPNLRGRIMDIRDESLPRSTQLQIRNWVTLCKYHQNMSDIQLLDGFRVYRLRDSTTPLA